MDGIVTLITEFGSFGLLLGLAGWIIYTYIKNESAKSDKKNELNQSTEAIKKVITDHLSIQ